MAGKLTVNPVQINDSATATNNFVLIADNLGGVKLSRGNDGATTQDILSVNSAGVVTLLAPPLVPAQSMVRLNTANGKGSTNTVISRFSNVVTNQGTDITYTDSATLGASFTINQSGVYSIMHVGSPVNLYIGISLNSSQLTTSVSFINITDVLSIMGNTASGQPIIANTTVYLPAGSVVRPHGTTTADNQPGLSQFTITRVA